MTARGDAREGAGAAVAVVQARGCLQCGTSVPERRRLCDDCRARRRAVTFLKQAGTVIERVDWQALGVIEVLIGRLELGGRR
jgi:hypothetical protein